MHIYINYVIIANKIAIISLKTKLTRMCEIHAKASEFIARLVGGIADWWPGNCAWYSLVETTSPKLCSYSTWGNKQ